MKKVIVSAAFLAAMLLAGTGFAQNAASSKTNPTSPAPAPAPKENHGKEVSGTAQSTPSGPGKGQVVSTEAKDNHGQEMKKEKAHHGEGHGKGHHKGPKK
ncbi:MAG: hypothetical protein HY063_11980 [Bacteroidetes bacterium]|nr:hypothetical protein [Bacteroidota bacterium]